MALAYGILTPAKAISKASYIVKNCVAAADRVFEVLYHKDTMPDHKNALKLSGSVSYTHLTLPTILLV